MHEMVLCPSTTLLSCSQGRETRMRAGPNSCAVATRAPEFRRLQPEMELLSAVPHFP